MASIAADKKKNRPKEKLLIALDDLDFTWTKREVTKAIMMWNSGYCITTMTEKLRPRDTEEDGMDEVALLIMHLKRQGEIKEREGGLFGSNK